ncbi:MAG TPA: tetratricopeptide repeat protein, partial [Polyangia bacterium]
MNPSQGVRRFLPAVALFFVAGEASSPKAVADSETGGRKHAAKANHLAAKNKCNAAVPEFNRAYRTLKDPTLLFNRAECYRKLGQDDEALKDYQQFLADMPEAPNRAAVEARVASLRGTTAAPPASAAPTVAGKDLPAAPVKELAAPAAKPDDKATAVAPAKAPAAKP